MEDKLNVPISIYYKIVHALQKIGSPNIYIYTVIGQNHNIFTHAYLHTVHFTTHYDATPKEALFRAMWKKIKASPM